MRQYKWFILFFCFFVFPLNVFADSASSSMVMEMSSGRILYSRDANRKKLIASITKIMTCIVVLENANLDKEVTVGEEVLKMYGTNIYIEVGEKLKIKDLLYGLMLRSGNDAAITLAVNTFGSEKKFVDAMNKKAKQLGMNNTTFENPHGLDEETKNYSTAADMAKLSKYAYQNEVYREIIKTKKYVCKSSLKSYAWYNRMSLINNYKYCIGGKNGYTPSAGKTLVSVAEKDDLVLGIVTLDDPDLYENHAALYDKFFSKYKLYTIIDKNSFTMDTNFVGSDVYVKNSFKYPLREDEVDNISTIIKISNDSKNDVVGKINVEIDKKQIGSVDVYRKKEEKKEDMSIFQKIKKLFVR